MEIHPSGPAEVLPYSLVGQDTWFSPTRPGFDSRWGNVHVFGPQIAADVFYVFFGGVVPVSVHGWQHGRVVKAID